MEKRTFKALLFDADGTIYDSAMLHQKAYAKVCRELYDFDFSKKFYFEECVIPYKRPPEILKERGIICDEKEFYKRKRAYYDTIARKELDAMPGLVTLLKKAKKQCVPCVIVSGSSHATLENSLQILSLKDFFKFRIGYEDTVGLQKPNPYPYEKALAQLGIDGKSGIAFEDTAPGITAAHRAGLFCVAIRNLTNTGEQLKEANLIVSSYDELKYTFENQAMVFTLLGIIA